MIDKNQPPKSKENKLFWLSFAEPGKFLGAVLVEAPDFMHAVNLCWMAGCNPGGEVMGIEIPKRLPEASKEEREFLAKAPRLTLFKREEIPNAVQPFKETR